MSILDSAIVYRNRAGSLGVSLDDGATIYNATGRQLPLNDAIWEEQDDELDLSVLSAALRGIIERTAAAIDTVDARDAAEEAKLAAKRADALRLENEREFAEKLALLPTTLRERFDMLTAADGIVKIGKRQFCVNGGRLCVVFYKQGGYTPRAAPVSVDEAIGLANGMLKITYTKRTSYFNVVAA